MSTELETEVTSINAIYGDDTLVQLSHTPALFALTIPSHPAISLRVEFPDDYPDAPPSLLGTQTVGTAAAKGEGAELAELVRDTLAEVYIPGAPCVFDLVEEVGARLQQLSRTKDPVDGISQASEEGDQVLAQPSNESKHAHSEFSPGLAGDAPPWTLSEVVTEKKSVFVARSAPVTSADQARQYLRHLLATDKKAAKATHNITAWRIRGANGVQYQDCDDDGETAAGSRVLHLLELMDVWDVMVVVTRWYGGVHLGPDRFRIINQTARDAVLKAGMAMETGKKKVKK